jgi:flagellar biosynthesis protein FliP
VNPFSENAQAPGFRMVADGLALIPTLVICLTGFTRIVIVWDCQERDWDAKRPPMQVIIGLALLLIFRYEPGHRPDQDTAYVPYSKEKSPSRNLRRSDGAVANSCWSRQQTDLNFFALRNRQREDLQEVPNHVVIPSFMTSDERGLSDRLFHLYTVYRDRYGRRQHADGHGDDDAAARHDITAV